MSICRINDKHNAAKIIIIKQLNLCLLLLDILFMPYIISFNIISKYVRAIVTQSTNKRIHKILFLLEPVNRIDYRVNYRTVYFCKFTNAFPIPSSLGGT